MSRQTAREALATLFTATGEFNQVYGYAPVDLQGMDKALAIYSDRTHHQQESAALEHNFYVFTLDVMIKRSGGESVEDTLDSLHDTIRSTIKTNQINANWDFLSLEEPSDAYFAEISGVAYRVERHTLSVKETT